MGTAVFTGAGLDQRRMLVTFYNPWVDSVVFTVWEARNEGQRLVDIDWVPGDLVRQANAEFDPRPLWLRGTGYRPDTLAQSVVTTVKAIETRFADATRIARWRTTLGIKDAGLYSSLFTPMLALTLYETQLRLNALAVPRVLAGEDARLAPLRKATAALIKIASTDGFAKLLAEAQDTTAPMKQAPSKINPKTVIGLAPVAYVVGDGHATVFFASTATADYTLSARFVHMRSARWSSSHTQRPIRPRSVKRRRAFDNDCKAGDLHARLGEFRSVLRSSGPTQSPHCPRMVPLAASAAPPEISIEISARSR